MILIPHLVRKECLCVQTIFHSGKEPQSILHETDFPSLFLTVSDYIHSISPKKRKTNRLVQQRSSSETFSRESPTHSGSDSDDEWEMSESNCSSSCESDPSVTVPMRFEQITRESDVKFFTGLASTEAFRCLFDYLLPKAKAMQYWRGAKQTQKEQQKEPSAFQQYAGRSDIGVGPPRKLSLEQELLLTLMKLRLALLFEDLAFRFEISTGTTSSILITWIKLCSKELSVLIIWPTRGQVKKTLPNCFRKLYPKVRCIIDCFECFTETPSGLDVAATMWSEYKHHYTIKVLVAITPTGAISYVSPAYGGRATDIFIVKDSGFMDYLVPYDEIMPDRGFKIKEELMLRMVSLCIPPSKAASMQMVPADVRKTSSIANVRIYVQQAIGRMKVFHVLKHELPISLLPLADDIVRVCAALCNLLPPLCTK